MSSRGDRRPSPREDARRRRRRTSRRSGLCIGGSFSRHGRAGSAAWPPRLGVATSSTAPPSTPPDGWRRAGALGVRLERRHGRAGHRGRAPPGPATAPQARLPAEQSREFLQPRRSPDVSPRAHLEPGDHARSTAPRFSQPTPTASRWMRRRPPTRRRAPLALSLSVIFVKPNRLCSSSLRVEGAKPPYDEFATSPSRVLPGW